LVYDDDNDDAMSFSYGGSGVNEHDECHGVMMMRRDQKMRRKSKMFFKNDFIQRV
jgi:hypothetical protein